MRGKLGGSKIDIPSNGITPAGAGKTPACRCCCWHRKDHPRRCGENEPQTPNQILTVGSPPQVRGKPIFPNPYPQQYRITPAGAGKTWGFSFPFDVYKDHPRRCGENRMMMSIVGIKLGSPPQVRGKLGGREHSGFKRGITPAGAGKTWGAPDVSIVSRDHPRRCGENRGAYLRGSAGIGSPPQVRGKLIRDSECKNRVADHPRRCGENLHG